MKIKIIRKINREDQVKIKCYEHFMYSFEEKIQNPILGKDYYNMGIDFNSCNEFILDDIKRKFDDLKNEVKIYKIIITLLLIINILLIIGILLNYI